MSQKNHFILLFGKRGVYSGDPHLAYIAMRLKVKLPIKAFAVVHVIKAQLI